MLHVWRPLNCGPHQILAPGPRQRPAIRIRRRASHSRCLCGTPLLPSSHPLIASVVASVRPSPCEPPSVPISRYLNCPPGALRTGGHWWSLHSVQVSASRIPQAASRSCSSRHPGPSPLSCASRLRSSRASLSRKALPRIWVFAAPELEKTLPRTLLIPNSNRCLAIQPQQTNKPSNVDRAPSRPSTISSTTHTYKEPPHALVPPFDHNFTTFSRNHRSLA